MDPKSVVCEFFRKGTCAKARPSQTQAACRACALPLTRACFCRRSCALLQGFKCKFSHDLAVERKGAKIDLFSDRREGGEDEGGMEDWDQEKLEAAIARKHGTDNHNRPTEIICKHFLDAIEKKQYGWFWVCPGGGSECKYRHALPPGYVLKSQIKALAAEAAANKMDIVDEIEAARASVAAVTPVTEAVFAAWKAKRAALKAAEKAAAAAERHKAGRLSGRELTELGGFTFEDDLEAGDSSSYAREDDMEEAFRLAAQQAAAQLEAARQKALGGAAAAQPGQAALDAALLEEDEDLAALQDALEAAELGDGGGGGARGGDSDSDGDGDGDEEEDGGGDSDDDQGGGE